MKFLIPLMMVFSAVASAAPTQLNIAFGASVPKDTSGQTLIEKAGPSRASGGEHIVIRLNAPKLISDIKISSFSLSKAGKTLIHSVTGYNGATPVIVDALSVFAKVTAGNPVNYQNLVMLPDTTFVEAMPNQAFSKLDLVVEGFTNNDASILLQITSKDSLANEDFLVTRTDDNETLGGYVNEANYAKFSPTDLASLMTVGSDPAPVDVLGKTFVCSIFTKLGAPQVNFKTRSYFTTPAGTLQSSSDREGANMNWAPTGNGLQSNIDNFNGCGKYGTINVLRRTGGGNLISEIVLNLNAYISLCTAAGYDPTATLAVETNSTFPSVLNAPYVVDSYEFCHLQN